MPKPVDLRNAIADSISAHQKSYEVKDLCDRVGIIQVRDDEGDPSYSKAGFVRQRLVGRSIPELIRIAMSLLAEWNDPALEAMVEGLSGRGVNGELMNIIFASDGPKPDIVLQDALNNRIEITRNAKYCLVYNRPLEAGGLSWAELVDWWLDTTAPPGRTPDREAGARALWKRLIASLNGNEPERLLFNCYSALYALRTPTPVPALLPQVYLHYDPFAAFGRGSLHRQRMDFLLLLPNHARVILEIDGKQHYSVGEVADPPTYARMVIEDRQLRLSGYEVYRFGGAEFVDRDEARLMLTAFFDDLLATHLGWRPSQLDRR